MISQTAISVLRRRFFAIANRQALKYSKTENRKKVPETWMEGEDFKTNWRDIRPIPEDDDFFENVWRSYRENQNIF